MRINTKIPKTFSLYVSINGKSGYMRLVSSQLTSGEINYTIKIVKKISDASKFVNFDNVKTQAYLYLQKYGFDTMKIIDDKLMKSYYIKNI